MNLDILLAASLGAAVALLIPLTPALIKRWKSRKKKINIDTVNQNIITTAGYVKEVDEALAKFNGELNHIKGQVQDLSQKLMDNKKAIDTNGTIVLQSIDKLIQTLGTFVARIQREGNNNEAEGTDRQIS